MTNSNPSPELSENQKKMLSGAFFIDGRHNRDFLPEAEELVSRGLLTRKVRVLEAGQWTVMDYNPTPDGTALLQNPPEPPQ